MIYLVHICLAPFPDSGATRTFLLLTEGSKQKERCVKHSLVGRATSKCLWGRCLKMCQRVMAPYHKRENSPVGILFSFHLAHAAGVEAPSPWKGMDISGNQIAFLRDS